ncbi:tRNA pseudouridine(38-40) synthase TruA [Actinomycetes bacterium NPDC127524]
MRYKAVVSYDGTHFAGYQVQPSKRTVQSEIEQALRKMHKGQEVKITASGRTDAGVHARGQVVHYDSPYEFPEVNWIKALNALLPDDIAILQLQPAPADFHARFDAKGKEYRYMISRSSPRDPFRRHYAHHYPYPLDESLMKEAMAYLKGTHDFTSFCSAKTEVSDKVRTIHEIGLNNEGDTLVFSFRGNGFLYNMVRILSGTILEAGSGKLAPGDIPRILEGKDRALAGKTAPGHGLYLWKVHYE